METVRELQGFLESSYKLMDLCHSYRNIKRKQKVYSPTKLKQMQAKINLEEKKPS